MNVSHIDAISRLFEDVLASARDPESANGLPRQTTGFLEQVGSSHTKLDSQNGVSEAMVSPLLERVRWHFQGLNQFASPSTSEISRLRLTIQDWLGELERALEAHGSGHPAATIISAANQALLGAIAAAAQTHLEQAASAIVSEQYAAETQLQILHVDPALLLEPVLDIGCGREAVLVKWLRERRINAIGLDHFADTVPGCLKADWNAFPYPPNQFGTVIAHLSFSLHFLHQHLRPYGGAREYAVTYMNVLRSLRATGRFIYAPGLPFIERLLPTDQYKIAKYPLLQLPVDDRGAAMFEQGLGENPMYTAQVTRV